MDFSRRTRQRIAGLVVLLALPVAARASLGDDAPSIERDRVAYHGSVVVTPKDAYVMHEITTPTGRVREYLAQGRVFAVAWDGHTVPDLSQLLGVHLETFQGLVKPQPGNHHVVAIDDPQLSVSLHKLPRGFAGRVVVPALLPAGVPLSALR